MTHLHRTIGRTAVVRAIRMTTPGPDPAWLMLPGGVVDGYTNFKTGVALWGR
jgi:hypothetical protein